MTLIAGIDTYCTLSEALDYFTNRSLSLAEWTAIEDDTKEIVLRMACQKLENEYYISSKVDSEQELQFPRIDIGTPQDVKDAQSELALYLYQNKDNKVLNAKEMGLGSLSFGNESYIFTSGGAITNIMSIRVGELLNKWLKKSFKVV